MGTFLTNNHSKEQSRVERVESHVQNIKARSLDMSFSVNFAKILKNTHCTEHLSAIFLIEVLSRDISKKSFSEYYESFP